MEFGLCCSLSQASLVMAAGFDYVELPAGQLFASESEPNYAQFEGLKVAATNLFIHGNLKLVGPDKGNVREYAERVIPRAAQAGVQVMVIGSGAARRSPAGYDLDAAEDDFLDAASLCSRIAAEHRVVVAPESLRPEETNVGCFLGDLARMLSYRGVAYTADSYHVLNQPGSMPVDPSFWEHELPFAPAHVHLGDRHRSWRVAEAPELNGFVSRLKDLDYSGRVSLECAWNDFEAELPLALEQARSLMQ